jgi:hypothetical protein
MFHDKNLSSSALGILKQDIFSSALGILKEDILSFY